MLLGWDEIEPYTVDKIEPYTFIEAGDFRMRLPMRGRRRQILARESWTYFVTANTIVPASEVPTGDPIRRVGQLYTMMNSLDAFWPRHVRDVARRLSANFKR
jgi:hypothetical protein